MEAVKMKKAIRLMGVVFLMLLGVMSAIASVSSDGDSDRDTTGPTVSSTVPVNAAIDVAVNSAITATFSESMDTDNSTAANFTVVNTTLGGTAVEGHRTYDDVSRTATFTPTATFPASTLFTVTITGITDLAGNALVSGPVPNPWTFTTGAAPDIAAPTVSSISPSSGPAAGNTSVVITGTGFVSGATVNIGGNSATGVTFGSATSITATTPAGTAGAKNVVVTNPDAQSGTLTGGFTYAAAPTVSSISRSSGPIAGGTLITITGTGFVSGATVSIGGNAATGVTFIDSAHITVTTPAGTVGAKSVVVTNPDIQSSNTNVTFIFTTGGSGMDGSGD